MELEKGDRVLIDGNSGFCDAHEDTITDITIKYNENDGVPYKVYWCKDGSYDGRTMHKTEYGTAYYIKKKL